MVKFIEGEEVIAVHDILNEDPMLKITQGDVKIVVVPSTPCCGGVIVQGNPQHFRPDDFEPLKRKSDNGGKDQPSSRQDTRGPQNSFDVEAALMAFNRLVQLPMFRSQQGFIPVEIFSSEVLLVMEKLGLAQAFSDKFK